jgi:hypothetical protein
MCIRTAPLPAHTEVFYVLGGEQTLSVTTELTFPARTSSIPRVSESPAEVDVEAALAWRDAPPPRDCGHSTLAHLCSYRRRARLRGTGRLAGTGVVEVDGVSHTAEHIVVATGADPFVPPIPGLRDLEGVWGTREATSMKAVPRRLLVLGGGPAGWISRRWCVVSAGRRWSSRAPSTCWLVSLRRWGRR